MKHWATGNWWRYWIWFLFLWELLLYHGETPLTALVSLLFIPAFPKTKFPVVSLNSKEEKEELSKNSGCHQNSFLRRASGKLVKLKLCTKFPEWGGSVESEMEVCSFHPSHMVDPVDCVGARADWAGHGRRDPGIELLPALRTLPGPPCSRALGEQGSALWTLLPGRLLGAGPGLSGHLGHPGQLCVFSGRAELQCCVFV